MKKAAKEAKTKDTEKKASSDKKSTNLSKVPPQLRAFVKKKQK